MANADGVRVPGRDEAASTLAPAGAQTVAVVSEGGDQLARICAALDEAEIEYRALGRDDLERLAAEGNQPALILLDLGPGPQGEMDGLPRLRALPATGGIPVVVVGPLPDADVMIRSMAEGDVDYVAAPLHESELVARVSTQVSLGDRRRQQLAELVRLEELEQLRDELVHVVVHDFRTPLGVIMANAGILQMELVEVASADVQGDLEGILLAARQLTTMTDDMLDARRLESAALRPSEGRWDIATVVRDVAEEARTFAPQRHVAIEGVEHLIVTCDRVLVSRVLRNLLVNALGATPPDLPVRVGVTAQDGYARVAVEDQGPRIDDALVEGFFEESGVGAARRAGAFRARGLGLTFSRAAILAQNGRIGIERGPAGGNTLWFTLPRD